MSRDFPMAPGDVDRLAVLDEMIAETRNAPILSKADRAVETVEYARTLLGNVYCRLARLEQQAGVNDET